MLLADSVAGIRKMEKALSEKEPDIEVVGEADDEPTAKKLISALQPQIVLTDFSIDGLWRRRPNAATLNRSGRSPSREVLTSPSLPMEVVIYEKQGSN